MPEIEYTVTIQSTINVSGEISRYPFQFQLVDQCRSVTLQRPSSFSLESHTYTTSVYYPEIEIPWTYAELVETDTGDDCSPYDIQFSFDEDLFKDDHNAQQILVQTEDKSKFGTHEVEYVITIQKFSISSITFVGAIVHVEEYTC